MEIALFPERLFALLRVSREQARWLNLLSSGILIIVITTWALDRVEALPHFCLFQRALGIPCPGCGILHSLNGSFHGDFYRAWIANPAGPVLAAALLFQVCSSGLMLAGLAAKRWLGVIDAALLKSFSSVALTVWIYKVSITIF